jgi:hypothetical protein
LFDLHQSTIKNENEYVKKMTPNVTIMGRLWVCNFFGQQNIKKGQLVFGIKHQNV